MPIPDPNPVNSNYDKQAFPFSLIMQAIIQRLVSYTEIDPAYVIPVATEKFALAHLEDRFIYIHYSQLQPDTDAGVGRRARRAYRNIRVYLYMRSSLDTFGSDNLALLNQLGMSDFDEQVCDALDEYTPTFISGGTENRKMTIEPLHRLDDSMMVEREPENDIGILRFSQVYQVVYVLPNISPFDQEAQII